MRQRQRVDLAAEGAGLSEARIVKHQDQDVWRVFRQAACRFTPLVNGLLHRRED